MSDAKTNLDRLRWAAVLLLFAGVAPLGCEPSPSKASPAAKAAEAQVPAVDPIPVETLAVESGDHDETFAVFGTLEIGSSVRVSAETAGRALDVPFEEGEKVRAGSRLIRVDTQLDSARIKVLESQVDSAQREFDRASSLAGQGLATPQQLKQTKAALETAQLNLRQAEIAASRAGVRSPVTGWIHRKIVDEGEWVAPGSPIAEIVDLERLELVGNVPESRLRFVSEGDSVQVHIPAMDHHVPGTIKRIGLQALGQTRTFPVEIEVENPELKLRAGMHARIDFVKKRWSNAVLIPRDAVLQGFSGAEAMVYPGGEAPEGAAELRKLKLGPNAGERVVVLDGLRAGDRLVVRGHRGLVDGALVRQVSHWPTLEAFRTRGAAQTSTSTEDTPEDDQP